MTANYHTPHATGAPLTSAEVNSPLAEMDVEVSRLAQREFHVGEYGAVGDNATDDAAAITAAITACVAAGGGTVFLPNKTCLVASTLAINANDVRILGTGQASILHFTGSGAAIEVGSKTSGSAISGIAMEYFKITGSASGDYGLRLLAVQDSRFNGLRITNFSKATAYGLVLDGQSVGSFVECTDDVFNAVRVDACYNGVLLTKDALDSTTDGANRNSFFGLHVSGYTGFGTNLDWGEANFFVGLDCSSTVDGTTGLRINDDVNVFFGVRTDCSAGSPTTAIGIDITSSGRDYIIVQPTGNGPPTAIRKASEVTGIIMRQTFNEWIGNRSRSTLSQLTEFWDARTVKNIGGSTIAVGEVAYTDSTCGEGEVKRNATVGAPHPWPQIAVENILASGLGRVALSGSIVVVNIGTEAVAVGDILVSSTSAAGKAMPNNAITNRRDMLGYARTTKTAGTNGTVKAWII